MSSCYSNDIKSICLLAWVAFMSNKAMKKPRTLWLIDFVRFSITWSKTRQNQLIISYHDQLANFLTSCIMLPLSYWHIYSSVVCLLTRNIRKGLSLSKQIPASVCWFKMDCSSLESNVATWCSTFSFPGDEAGRMISGILIFANIQSFNRKENWITLQDAVSNINLFTK